MTRRFFVEPGVLDGDSVEFDGPLAHRIAGVLRLKAGDAIALFDGSGDDVTARIERATPSKVSASITGRLPGPREPRTSVALYQSITKGERFEWLVEKATELGVARVVPLVTARAVVKTQSGGNRADRWRRIAVEAAEQCERSTVPAMGNPATLDAALAESVGIVLLPYEDSDHAAPSIGEALNRDVDALFTAGAVSILIGPEGGYEPAEIERAAAAGATIVTLGDRVLRSETAGLVALTLVMQAIGELG